MLRLEDLTLRLHPADNVVVVKRPLKPGVELESGSLRLVMAKGIPPGHKLAIAEIADGAPVTKYGQTIGFAKGRIAPGDHVHTHNVELRDFGRDYAFGVDARPVAYRSAAEMRSFQGYARPNGKAGTRNYIGIISSVNCSAGVSRYVADRFRGPDFARDFPGIDGVVPFTHKIGCGIQPGAPHELLQRVTAGIARHPNIAGYVMIGLGCEVNQVHLVAEAHKLDLSRPGEQPPTFLTIQNSGGVRKTVEAGAAAVTKLLPAANAMRRTSLPRFQTHPRRELRRLRRQQRHHRKPCARRRLRRTRALRRHQRAGRDAGDLRCRAPAHAPRGVARRRAKDR